MANILTPGYLRWDGAKFVTDPDVDVTGPSGPQGDAGAVGPQGATGSGINVFPDGYALSGTYDSDVFCQGNATVAGNLIVNGDLIVVGDLTNDSGHTVTTAGDLRAANLNFDAASPSQLQSNLTVGGDLTTSYIYFVQTPGSTATLEVRGNLIVQNDIYANGINDANGLNIIVWGNLYAVDVNISGGAAVAANNAGNGGTLTVSGNVSVYVVYASGGFCDDSILLTGLKSAGNGGLVEAYSDFRGGISLFGGNGIEASAGNGGECYIDGVGQLTYFDAHGGICTSDNENHAAGRGGYLEARSGITSRPYVNLSGGNRFGTLSADGLQLDPSGGSLIVDGECNVESVDARGGNIYTSGGSPSFAGEGGTIFVIGGSLNAYSGDLRVSGGSSDLSQAGDAGSITVEGDIRAYSIELNGGTVLNSSGNGSAGNGGDLECISIYAHSIAMTGGSSDCGNSGDGGYISCAGNIESFFEIDLSGSTCESSNETHRAGTGGYLQCDGSILGGIIRITGGDRLGTVSSSNFLAAPSAGGVNIAGSLSIFAFYGNGGEVNTNLPVCPGGDGANVYVKGKIYCGTNFYCNGGNSNSYSAGNGGTITGRDDLVCLVAIYAIGGDGNNVDAGNGGEITVDGDLKCSYVSSYGGFGFNGNGGDGGDVYSDNLSCYSVAIYGGDSQDTTLSNSFYAGNGGNIYIRGDLTVTVYSGITIVTNGGEGFSSGGGWAGNISINGDAIFSSIQASGGNCDSSYESHFSGRGGYIYIFGDAVGDSIYCYGGNRTGTLSAPLLTDFLGPRSGDVTIAGDLILDGVLNARGGNISATGPASLLSTAGSGGQVYVRGSILSRTSISLSGGDSTITNAGSGGRIFFLGCAIPGIIANGGSSLNGAGGSGGQFQVLISGSSSARGSINIGTVEMNGGDGVQGSGGNAGSIDSSILGCSILCDSIIELNGGNCNSTDGSHRAGSGGTIRANSLIGQCNIFANGGNRTGNTTAFASHSFGAGGGFIDILDGPINVRGIYLNGGSSSPTDPLAPHYPNTPGGDGGSIRCFGSCHFYELESVGGDSYGAKGGDSGYLEVHGICTGVFANVLYNGGSSYAISTPAAPASTKGLAGSVKLYSGASLGLIQAKDGVAGSAITTSQQIILGGTCNIGSLWVTNRSEIKILGWYFNPPMVRIGGMPEKTTLDTYSSTTTTSLTSFLSTSIFSLVGSTWYRHTGTSVM